MSVEWQGLDPLVSIIKEGPARGQKAVMAELVDTAYEAFANSQREVPVHHGVLKGSGTVDVEDNEVVIGYGGPAASYALAVHENLAAHHRPPTKAKYLEDPVNVAIGSRPDIQATVEAAIVGQLTGASIGGGIAVAGSAIGMAKADIMKHLSHSILKRGKGKKRMGDIKAHAPMSSTDIHAALRAIKGGQRLDGNGIPIMYRAK